MSDVVKFLDEEIKIHQHLLERRSHSLSRGGER
jgi:hypothetical protein